MRKERHRTTVWPLEVFALRFRAYGRRRYLTLGSLEEGWTRRRAEEELWAIRTEVSRGAWVAPPPRRRGNGDTQSADAMRFGPFATTQVRERRGEVRPATSRYREWALGHLVSFFHDWPLSKIDIWEVDAYRIHMVEESEDRRQRLTEGRPRSDALGLPLRPLSPSSINKTIEILSWLLSLAVEYGLTDDNPAVGRRRRIKVDRCPAPHLESANQIAAVVEAAADLDADPGRLIDDRLAVVTVLVFAGLRVHELADLRWGDLDFVGSLIQVRRSKTAAGIREIKMLPVVREQLLRHRHRCGRLGAGERVFRTRRGGRRTKDNVRLRVLAPVLVRAGQLLEARGLPSLPLGITPHSLRHTYTSLLFAMGEDPVSVMSQVGHTDPGLHLAGLRPLDEPGSG